MSKATEQEKTATPPARRQISLPRAVGLFLLALLPIAAGGLLLGDWWFGLPEDARATYVGRRSCAECHQAQFDGWHGSHHDLAMDPATAETVLGDFADAEVKHYGITSRMFQRDGKFFVHTEGEDGGMDDFEVKYVFGVEPLQQYLVEFDRTEDMPKDEIARLQVLPVSWDTQRGQWFYLDPPDVHEQLAPDDRLHWTNAGQNWNRMCADCHSTNLQKGFDDETRRYHTTFSEIDVSCEACHGPASLHVQLARQPSLFWDRHHGYGLAKLKGDDHITEIETCARCHVRRHRIVAPDYKAGEPFYDHFANALIREGAYHADGQVRDEVYVYGSYIQSKMYHKGVRCTDCHDPHTTKVKYNDNRLCTSCHTNTHPAGKYDTPGHHHHPVDSSGALCVNCHMPHTTFMEVDARRDHSLRVPRPDLSVKLGTSNACTGCHIDATELGQEAQDAIARSHTRDPLEDYASWLLAAEQAKDAEVRDEIRDELTRLDTWSRDYTRQWYGAETENQPHFATALTAAWQGKPEAEELLIDVVRNEKFSPIARASALVQLHSFQNEETNGVVKEALKDEDPQVRFAALGYYEQQVNTLADAIREADTEADQMAAAAAEIELRNPQSRYMIEQRVRGARVRASQARQALEQVAKTPAPLLDDPVRLVRTEAARILAAVPGELLDGPQRRSRKQAIEEYVRGLMVDNDWALAHHSLGLLYERLAQTPEEYAKAVAAYRRAIHVEPDVTGPRSNLAELLERLAATEKDPGEQQKLILQFRELRREETALLGREARLLPDNAMVQYRYGLSLYLIGEEEQAVQVLSRAHELAPESVDILLRLALLYKKRQQWDKAVAALEKLLLLQPENQMFQHVLRETRAERQAARSDS